MFMKPMVSDAVLYNPYGTQIEVAGAKGLTLLLSCHCLALTPILTLPLFATYPDTGIATFITLYA